MNKTALNHVISFFLFVITCLCFVSCEESEKEVTPEILVSPQSLEDFNSGISFPSSSEQDLTASVMFTATSSWSANVSETKASSWLSIQPSSGKAGDVNMTLKAQANTSENVRSATVTITSGTVQKSFIVTQYGAFDYDLITLDLSSELGKEDVFYMINDDVYVNYILDEEQGCDKIYFNTFENEMEEGVSILRNKTDGSLACAYGDAMLYFYPIDDNVYNIAIQFEDEEPYYFYGYEPETEDENPSESPSKALRMTVDDEMLYLGVALKELGFCTKAIGYLPVKLPFELYEATIDWFDVLLIGMDLATARLVQYANNNKSWKVKRYASVAELTNEAIQGFHNAIRFKIGNIALSKYADYLDEKGNDLLRRVGSFKPTGQHSFGKDFRLRLSQSEIVAPSYGGVYMVDVKTDLAFEKWGIDEENSTAVSTDWCRVFRPEGAKQLFVEVLPYDGTGNVKRGGLVTLHGIKTGRFVIQPAILVIQRMSTRIDLSESSLEFEKEGGNRTIIVSCSEDVKDWDVWSSDDWCKVSKEGDGCSFSVSVTGADEDREGTITVSVQTNYDQTFYKEIPVRQIAFSEDKQLREQLIQFYKDTDGDHWIHNDNWCSDKPLDEWYGVSYGYYGGVPVYFVNLSDNGLKGTVAFNRCPGIGVLNLQNNALKSIDICECPKLCELWCYENQLTFMSVLRCPMLERVVCNNNLLSELYCSGCVSLKLLSCCENVLTTIDLAGCTSLSSLSCCWNQLTVLDLTDSPGITDIDCSKNPQLASFRLPDCPFLTELTCYYTSIPSLDLTGCSMLTRVNCGSNQKLCSLKLDGCIALTLLDCSYSNLRELDLTGCSSLTHLDCFDSLDGITSLTLKGCSSLTHLNCEDNKIETLDLSDCKALVELNCNQNRLSSLDLSGMSDLIKVSCYNNWNSEYGGIHSLVLSGCSSLSFVFCSENEITSLDLTGLSSLTQLQCWRNRLTSIDISPCPKLTTLGCIGNDIIQEIKNEDALEYFSYDVLYEYLGNGLFIKHAAGWYYPGEPEKGYHGR